MSPDRWNFQHDDDHADPGPDDLDVYDDAEHPETGTAWRRSAGIFVLAEIGGAAGEQIRELQLRYDPKLAATSTPHVTLVGSSGAGPIRPGTTIDALRAAIAPIAATTAPLRLPLGLPMRFMQTEIVVLPLAPHGALRQLHERILTSGLHFDRARFAFSPHATLSFYPTLTPATRRELLAVRVREPATIEWLSLSVTNDPQPPTRVLEVELTGVGQA